MEMCLCMAIIFVYAIMCTTIEFVYANIFMRM